MSECKFLSEQGTGMCSIAGCGCTYLHPNLARCIEEENIDAWEELSSLRAKLDEKERMLNLANQSLENAGSAARFGQSIEIPEDALVFKDTEETLRVDDDDEPAYSTKQWNELQAKLEAAEVKVSKYENRLEISPYGDDKIDELEEALKFVEFERDVLQRNLDWLQETDRHREFCMVEMAHKIAEYEHDEGVDLAFVLDRYEEHRNYVVGLETTIAQMREALGKAMNHLVCYAKQSDTGLLYQICRQTLDSVPPTAYEQKVRGMVDALEVIIAIFTASGNPYETLNEIHETTTKALAAFRGGEKA